MARYVVDVMPKQEILDPQGKAVLGALSRLGFQGVADVRQGKRFEVELEGDPDDARLADVRRMAETLLANPVIEDYTVTHDEPSELPGEDTAEGSPPVSEMPGEDTAEGSPPVSELPGEDTAEGGAPATNPPGEDTQESPPVAELPGEDTQEVMPVPTTPHGETQA